MSSKLLRQVRLFLILSFSTGALADLPGNGDRVLPCRPTIACTADIVPPGTFEVEAGALARRLAGVEQLTLPFLLKLTVADGLQLQVGSNGYTALYAHPPVRFFDDIVLGPKLHFLNQGHLLPSLSFSAEVSVPTVERYGYIRTVDALFTGYVSKDIGWLHADLNLGFNLWRLESAPLTQEWTALALSTNVTKKLQLMAEGYIFSNASPIASKDGGLLLAVSYTVRPWLVFDLGGDASFFPATRSYSLFAGLTIIPAVIWRPKATL